MRYATKWSDTWLEAHNNVVLYNIWHPNCFSHVYTYPFCSSVACTVFSKAILTQCSLGCLCSNLHGNKECWMKICSKLSHIKTGWKFNSKLTSLHYLFNRRFVKKFFLQVLSYITMINHFYTILPAVLELHGQDMLTFISTPKTKSPTGLKLERR